MLQNSKGTLLEKVVAVVGPTASGKTDLALALAERLGGEVVSADSRQVYRGLDAGTAKPVRDARGRVQGVPCHLLDCADPSEPFDAGSFARLAGPLLSEIRSRARLPIVAGGTGLYLRALREGLSNLPPRDEAVRRRLREESDSHGREALHERLSQVDPEAARKIPPGNLQRVMRALEVHELTGKPISESWRRESRPREDGWIVLSIEWEPEALRRRIEERSRRMWPGVLEEVRRLVPSRFTGREPGFQSLGYGEALRCLRGEISSDEGLSEMIRSSWAYARRQRTWFRGQEPGRVVIPGGPLPEMLRLAEKAI